MLNKYQFASPLLLATFIIIKRSIRRQIIIKTVHREYLTKWYQEYVFSVMYFSKIKTIYLYCQKTIYYTAITIKLTTTRLKTFNINLLGTFQLIFRRLYVTVTCTQIHGDKYTNDQ